MIISNQIIPQVSYDMHKDQMKSNHMKPDRGEGSSWDAGQSDAGGDTQVISWWLMLTAIVDRHQFNKSFAFKPFKTFINHFAPGRAISSTTSSVARLWRWKARWENRSSLIISNHPSLIVSTMIVVWLALSVSNHRHRHHHSQGGWTIIVILLHHDHLHHHVHHHEHHPQGGREGGSEVWETDRGAWIQPPAAPGIHPHDTQVCPALIKSGLLRRKGSRAARTCSSRSSSSPRPTAAPLPSDRSLSDRSTMLKKRILVDIYNLAEPDCCWIDLRQPPIAL